MTDNTNFTAKLIRSVLASKLPLAILILSVLAGAFALKFTAREEEPQIVVPMIDVVVTAKGVNARQVERLITTPLEKLLSQITGVEHVYSASANGQSVVTLRFYVGENREMAILNTHNKLMANENTMPAIVNNWLVRPQEVDDVPILMLGLWSDDPEKTDDFTLRRLAEEISTVLQRIEDTSEVNIVGGRPRVVQVNLNPEQLSARKTSIAEVFNAIQVSNVLQHQGSLALNHQSIRFESGDVYRSIESLAQTPINVIDGSVVLLKDVASIVDGPDEARYYTWIDFAQGHRLNQNNASQKQSATNNTTNYPVVTISVAKQRGSNAVIVSKKVKEKINLLQKTLFPSNVHVEILRDYGETANQKVNNLTTSLVFAIFTVVVFIGVFLGWRAAVVVGLAVPICYGITLAIDLAFGYTINRVTLFALILSLGLLVDDPITGVDNIERYLKRNKGNCKDNLTQSIVGAINEIRVPLLLSTLAIVLAFAPLAFITGMMGPYMAPMAFNVPLSVMVSTLVAFFVTPWLAAKFLKHPPNVNKIQTNQASKSSSFYRKILTPLLESRSRSKVVLLAVFIAFVIAAMLPVMRFVPLKLLPFDNKNEIQIIIDMPESTPLEQTAALAKNISAMVQLLPEIKAISAYVGIASPIDFNGLVRQYYQRQMPNTADLRLTLIDKGKRQHQSHAIVLRLRALLAPLTINGVHIKVVEVPPGPPVMNTLVAELYGSEFTPYENIQQSAMLVTNRLAREALVVEIDTNVEEDQQRLRFITDKTKAALSGISTDDINQVLTVANQGRVASFMHEENEASPLAINVQLPVEQRENLQDFYRLSVKGRAGVVQKSTAQGIDIAPQSFVALGELGTFEQQINDKTIFHKDLKPVVYVMAEISGRTPVEIITDVAADLTYSPFNSHYVDELIAKANTRNNKAIAPSDWQTRTFITPGGGDEWTLPKDIQLVWSGEGEWRITIRVFRDMGLAFAFALVGIYFVLRIQTASTALSLIIMSAIPLTVIGIMPAFFMLNQLGEREIAGAPDPVLFTATAMIGMIALAGIVVRNSLILVEFITQARAQGATIKEALLEAGAVRMRPVLLTAGTTLLGNLIITLDPVFSGLAIAIIFGIISSTVFTLFVIPIVYLLVFEQPVKNEKLAS
jgi:multidrug efflux pump subunit AcrB